MASFRVQIKKGSLIPGTTAHVGKVVILAAGTMPLEVEDDIRALIERAQVLVASVMASPPVK